MFGQRAKICTIHALKDKLNAIKIRNWIFKEKNSDFNLEQAEISVRELSKITTHLPF
jgi:hypothetical protein